MSRTPRILLVTALALAAPALAPGPLAAGQVERACAASPRAGGDAGLCRCIQGVADQTLTARDQRRAAGFFDDPHRAQEVRMSARAQDSRFWDRYRAFGRMAQRVCG